MKMFNYCGLIKVRLDDRIDDSIINEFYPGTITNDEDYDYQIILDDSLIKSFVIPNTNEVYKPFKSSDHIVIEDNDRVISYSLKNSYSNPYLCVRDNKNIIVSLSDNNMINIVRILSELITRTLLGKGFYPIHASSTVLDGKSSLYFGASGSGKSTMFFKDICLGDSLPQSNDITFVGYEKGILKSYSTGFEVSFSPLLVGEKQNKKIRYTPYGFSNQYNKEWIHESKVESINYTSLDLINSYQETILDLEKIIEYLKLYGKDRGFEFDDIFKINGLSPEYKYEELGKKLRYRQVTGNIKK